MFRVGGRDTANTYAGSFGTMREARLRRDWVAGELSAKRVPKLTLLAAPATPRTLRQAAEEWKASRVDVTEATRVLHRVALDRVLPLLGDRPVDTITADDVAADRDRSRRVRPEARDDPQERQVPRRGARVRRRRPEPGPRPRASGSPTRSTSRSTRRPPRTSRPSTGRSRPPTGWRCSGSTGQARGSPPSTCSPSATTTSATGASGCGRRRRRHGKHCGSTCPTRSPTLSRRPCPPETTATTDARLFPGVTADRLRTAIARACRANGRAGVLAARPPPPADLAAAPAGPVVGGDRPVRRPAEAERHRGHVHARARATGPSSTTRSCSVE